MQNQLLNLLRNNARRDGFRAEDNTLYVYDVIVSSKADAEWFGGVDAETFVQALQQMNGDVSIRVNSPGGDVFGGRAMASAIQQYAGNVTVHVDGFAASAASLLVAAAGTVSMADGAFLMIHDAWTIALGNSEDFMSIAALLEKIDGTIADSYALAATNRGATGDAAAFRAMMDAETWLTPQEAIDAGLADEIAVGSPKATAKWDLSAYAHAPANEPAVEEPIIEQVTEEIEQPRPNMMADMLLRPAA